MAPWVSKKIADYLGEEEPMLIKYVLEMLTEHSTAQSIIEKLAVVLEDEAETFVIKLWRCIRHTTVAEIHLSHDLHSGI